MSCTSAQIGNVVVQFYKPLTVIEAYITSVVCFNVLLGAYEENICN